MKPQTHTVQLGPPGRYFVRNEATNQPVYSTESKRAVIAAAERLNGWPITGSEARYAVQALRSRMRSSAATALAAQDTTTRDGQEPDPL